MLLAIAGVTGVGKSYYKDEIVKELGFEKIKIITTRGIRKGEKNAEDKIFVSKEELQALENEGKIAYKFNMLGNSYAYSKEELSSKRNTVVELHYSTIFDLKKICPQIKTIYIFPKDINMAKEKVKERKLAPEVEAKRIEEIDEHYKNITTDEKLRNMFDCILYNEYNEKSRQEVIKTVKKMLEISK